VLRFQPLPLNSQGWNYSLTSRISGSLDVLEKRENLLFLPGMELIQHVAYKGKGVLLQAWSGLEGSRKLRFPDFMTMAQDGGKVVSLTHRPPLPPGNTPGTHFC